MWLQPSIKRDFCLTMIVILDRDGVINEDSTDFIKSVDEFFPIPGSLEAIAKLSQAGWKVFVVSNQSGISRGLLTASTLNRIHGHLLESVQRLGGQIEAILFCPHGPDDRCLCRKPFPGLLESLADRSGLALNGAILVGDALRDLEAAKAMNLQPVLVETGKGGALRQHPWIQQEKIPIFPNLQSFVHQLIETAT